LKRNPQASSEINGEIIHVPLKIIMKKNIHVWNGINHIGLKIFENSKHDE
jgi:hypothetical protein